MNEANTRYCKAVRNIRSDLGISQAELAKRARAAGHKLTASYLSELESGLRAWSTKALTQVSDGLGVSVSFLMMKAGRVSIDEVGAISRIADVAADVHTAAAG